MSLNGDESTNPDGNALSYSWRQTSGPSVALLNSTSATPELVAPTVTAQTAVEFELTVSDTTGASATDTVAITVEPATEETTLNVSRSLSSAEVTPGESVTMTVTAHATSDSISISDTFNRFVANTTIQSVTIDEVEANPAVQEATVNGTVVTLSGVQPGESVDIVYRIDISSEAPSGTTYQIRGTVTSGANSTASTRELAVVEPQGPVDRFDRDGNGIDIAELGQAAIAFAQGDLTISELGQVAIAFAQS